MNLFKKIYKTIVPLKIRELIYQKKLFFTNREKYNRIKKNKKRRVSYGPNNKDIHFFVCRRDHKATGLLACYVNILGQLIEINEDVEKGNLIPVLDMYTEHYELIHNNEDGVLKVNAWEYYFEPLSNYTMEDVLKSKNVTLGYGYLVDAAKPFVQDYPFTKDTITNVLPIHNKFFKLKGDLKQSFEKEYVKLFGEKRILGTNIREGYMVLANGRDNNESEYGDYKENINGHPKQIAIDELCNELEKKMKEWNCDFLYAEYQTTYIEEILNKRFGDRFIHTNRERIKVDNLSLRNWREAIKKRPNTYSVVENNIEYLKDIYLLSKCTSLFSSKCSGTVVAALWNGNKYEHMEIINKGTY